MNTSLQSIAILSLTITSIARAQVPNTDSWQRLHQQLGTITSLHLSEIPLDQALDTLGRQVGVQFTIDPSGLDELGLAPDEKVSISVEGVSLNTLLELMLRPEGLAWTIREGVFVITSEDQAMDEVVARVYAVPDLLGSTDELPEFGPDYDSLIDTIISVIDSDTWVENGGPDAEIRPLYSSGAIVVSQSIQSHLKIEQLLADIRHVRSQQSLPIATHLRTNKPASPRTPPTKTYVQPLGSTPLPRSYVD